MDGLDIVHYSIIPYKILSLDSEAWLLAFCGDHGNNKKIACGVELGVWWGSIIMVSCFTRVIHKATLCFTPYPLFQWYPQSKEILLNLGMRFESNYSSCTGRSSENICSCSGGAEEKGKTG
jgi:hypothetical protein